MQLASLFGWRRGAFTGADRDTAGAVARADGGSLFIDEVDKLSLETQAGLLQFLEDRRYRPLGHAGPLREARVRLLVGTNADLEAAAAEGRFLRDLWYRINVLPIRVPGLDERRDEIPAWARFMVARWRGGGAQIAPEAAELLARQDWPGNLRELDNVVRRACAMALAERVSSRPIVEARHVRLALSFGGQAASRPARYGVLPALDGAVGALIEEARERVDRGERFSFALLEALPALTLSRALTETGSLGDAYALLGRESLVKARSYHRDFRRRVQRIIDLYEALDQPLPADLAEALDAWR